MTDFKIGDKVRIKKLSEEEFEKIYNRKHSYRLNYKRYLISYNQFFNKTFEIYKINDFKIYCKSCGIVYFYKEEVEKVSYLKIKFKIINKLLEN